MSFRNGSVTRASRSHSTRTATFPDLDEAVAASLDELARTAAPQRRLLLGSSPRSQAEVANDQRIVVGAEGFEPPTSSL